MTIKYIRVNVNEFMSTYLSLGQKERISHSDLNKMNKVAQGLNYATNSINLCNRMKIKDQHDVDKRLEPLFKKLINQKSRQYDKKKDKLTAISNALKSQVNKNSNVREHYANRYQNYENQLRTEKFLIEQEILKHVKIKNSNIEKADFLKCKADECRSQLRKIGDADVASLMEEINYNLSKAEKNIVSLHNELREISCHATKRISNLEHLLRLAVNNKIYNTKNWGVGPTTWKSYLSSDAYAKKYFGTQRAYGKRSHFEREITSVQGKKWQSVFIDYCNAHTALTEYENALKKGRQGDSNLTERCRMALEKEVSRSVDIYNKKHEKYTKRVEKTIAHLRNLQIKLAAYNVEIDDVIRRIARIREMGNR